MKSTHFKRLLFLLILTGSLASCSEDENIYCDCADELFYYHRGEKIFRGDNFLNNWLLIAFEPHVQDDEIINFINQAGYFEPLNRNHITHSNTTNLVYVKTKAVLSCLQLKEIIRRVEKSSFVMYANLTFKGKSFWGKDYIVLCAVTQYFYVEVKDKDDLEDLYAVAQETNTWVVEQDPYLTTLVTLRATKNSNGNTMQISQYFYETGKFLEAQPSFYEKDIPVADFLNTGNTAKLTNCDPFDTDIY